MDQLRLFVALQLPEPVRKSLSAWSANVADEVGPGLRTVGAESLHVTLCFLGSLPGAQVARIGLACQAVRGMGVGELATSDALWLPRRRPQVLAVELADPRGLLGAVHAELARSLTAIGAFRTELRPFLPHVTVARVRRGAGVRPVDLPPPPVLRFAAEGVVLYRSHLGRGPARYEALHQVPLSQR